jgi:hypothetical protein
MTRQHPKWSDMLNAVLAGKFSWQQLENMYEFPAADLEAGKEWVNNQIS